ncbi:MAG: transaldolase [Chloroflexi bacterium]|nr:MAG: transaldolase [Chloroflexota bacterium]
MKNPLVELYAYGQSFWYDNIRRRFLLDGTVQRLIDEDGLRGMTSNPSIFEKAIGGSDDYDEQMQALIAEGRNTAEIYESLALTDIQKACDLFAELYELSDGEDGYVSLEVSPHLAHDTEGTVAEAKRLFTAVSRPNVMIKVPATPAGIPAIRQLIADGVNVNVTLMFSMAHYEAVAQAYMDGLQLLLTHGGDVRRVASVASFFVSRVDTAVDKQLATLSDPVAPTLMGKVAIANSRLVYQRFKQLFHGNQFAQLRQAGARVQRLLWASTSTKNPNYPDTLYIDELIGPETVTTIPPQTIDAFRDHGKVGYTLEKDLDKAHHILDTLPQLGINLNEITEQLQQDGVKAFAHSFDQLMGAIENKQTALQKTTI